MGNFLALVQNENMKIYRRLRTWIMFGMIIVLPIVFAGLIAFSESHTGSSQTGAWDMAKNLGSIYFLVSIFTLIVAADIVAGEFTWGTVKLLLIRPWSRSKVLLSKLLSVLLFSILMSIVFFIVIISVSMLFFQNTPPAFLELGSTPLEQVLLVLLYKFIDLLVISSLAFMISTVFRASGIAIGLSMFIMMAGNTIAMLLNPIRYPWAKYLLFHNMDLSKYVMNTGGDTSFSFASLYEKAGMSMGFSAIVLAVYVVVFLAIAWMVFKRRDVAA
ncbi:ABC transporter permease [Paenibacillus sp. J22TS3]|uniref:ABC transporter permease n=1 Tax=Paenibacillus sp. J22TS3 TaxID=2807192 RepID=UPI001B037816|nr:ABC transporter permease subunit [Paenibacillus sp. J22TS3]GIP22709.1 hypothetical protein J22TS3_29840 [Paenibacillus sp. J22TS3]